jgi:hypothetical protein
MISIAALKNEIMSDPLGLGYAVHLATGNHKALADLINYRRDGVSAPSSVPGAVAGPAILVPGRVEVERIFDAIDVRDISGSVTNAQLTWLRALFSLRWVFLANPDGTNSRTMDNLLRIVTSDTNGSRTRLQALAKRNGSRAEQLFGIEESVSPDDIGKALLSGV